MQDPAVVCPVNVAKFIAVEKVTAMVDDASGVAPSAGVVLTTVGGDVQTPPLSHCVPPVVQTVPTGTGKFDGIPAEHISAVHSLASTGKSASSGMDSVVPAPLH